LSEKTDVFIGLTRLAGGRWLFWEIGLREQESLRTAIGDLPRFLNASLGKRSALCTIAAYVRR
jgi:hypothetical protein